MSALINFAARFYDRTKPAWYENQDDVRAFLAALNEGDEFATLDAPEAVSWVIAYLEKPWKWTDEYATWVYLGRPEETTLDEIARELEKAS